jgi:predicted NBD/HSP70 family sugar kinase
MNHRRYRGAQRLGLELGRTKVQIDCALWRCGQRGCLEAHIAEHALSRGDVTALNVDSRQRPSACELLGSLFLRAKAGDDRARKFGRDGRYLPLGLANIVNLFDPVRIILSRERMRYDYHLPTKPWLR